jgi:hypothetical protein
MSYIRSTSNDEHLYIFANMDGIVEFHRGTELVGTMPQEIFNVLIDLYIQHFCEDVEFHDANVREMFVDGKPITRLEYKHNWQLDMQYVTWYYIARSNYGRSMPRWKRKLLRKFFGYII